MRKWIRRISAGVLTVALVTSTASGVLGEFAALRSYAVDDCNDDWLHAEGDGLYDAYGNEVWLTGVNWFGFNCGENILHGLWSADVDELISDVADHGFNCFRFPISTELIYSWMNGTPNAVSSVSAGNDPPYYVINPDFLDENGVLKNSMEIFDVIIGKCKKYGIKVILDIHSPAAHNSGHNYNVWYYNSSSGDCDNMAVTADGVQVTTEMWQDTLVWIAEKYANDDTIIAYDLKNEPHGKGQEGVGAAKWDGSTDENNWAYAATQCANAIYEVNPNALILVEGVEQYLRSDSFTWGQPDSESNPPYYPAWWGGQLRGVRDYPIVPNNGTSQIVYSPHDYGPSVYAQTWFDKDFTTETLLEDYWYDTWAFIDAEGIAPLLIGEWGGHMGENHKENEKWMTLLRDYMIENRINHTFWCLNPNSGDTGGLLDSSFATWDEEKYSFVEVSLWQDEDGKYIGLDHQVALGVNGLSLNEYYQISSTEPGTTTATTTTVTTTVETSAGTASVLYGDANCDGDIKMTDVVLLNKVLNDAATLTEQGKINANVNLSADDENVTASDASRILTYISGQISYEDLIPQ